MTRRILQLALMALLPMELSAQRALKLSLGGGGSFGLGRFNDVASPGWHALAGFELSTLMLPQSLRLDVAHNRFTARAITPDQAVTSATLNLMYRLPMTNSRLSPYLITGAGAYFLQCIGAIDCEGATKFGWNAGLGTRIAALGGKWFLESRFHAVNAESGNIRFVPVTLGLTF